MKINIVFYQPEIPGNTGNTMRTAVATNSKFHIIKPLAFDLDHPKMKRFAAGYDNDDFDMEVHKSYDEFISKYGNKKIFYITRYGMKNYADKNYVEEAKLNGGEIWIMFGRESTGIPKQIMKQDLDRALRIPMSTKARSLNLATAVNIVCYEILRQFNFEGLSEFEVQKGKDWILNDN
ncbi:tRNA (cytidine/uridine-2'-O-)-methyltransferase [Mycoplasma testudineum]|uniref:Putative tRNA (cytidine(34)-2'-O)-methyltransferase n=1 Tax=Mycoplasma testudineum TaxID=244584 RepID=A0A4R6IH97_9MOLU|nr:tRNA (cytidine(34)-2'-O)-methyltransferase [Mycoplasma testudineum]OYD27069.1 RNA methyltransferase [Mycoplasma testudineum]TDO21177.1 tRNA (cytidine/uridine-2'-O-)-methyltransferase [Mycoplasma testudineum]